MSYSLLITEHLAEKYPNIPKDEYYYSSDIFSILKTAMKYYPVKSAAYDDILYHVKTDLRDKYGENEYVLCIERSYFEKVNDELEFFNGSDDELPMDESIFTMICDNATFIPRYICEYNPKYIQISVAGKYKIEDTDKYLLERSLEGPLSERITLVQGHTSYSPEINGIGISSTYNTQFKNYIKHELNRELKEEIGGFTKVDYPYDTFRIIYPSNDFRTIDAYHLGIIRSGTIKVNDIKDLTSLECDKHEVLALSEDELKYKYPKDILDNYVKRAFSIR